MPSAIIAGGEEIHQRVIINFGLMNDYGMLLAGLVKPFMSLRAKRRNFRGYDATTNVNFARQLSPGASHRGVGLVLGAGFRPIPFQ